MSIFQNSFFSWAGQVERLTNVKDTLISAVTGKGVQSNTGIKAVDKVLSAAASNPFTTAAVVAVGVNPSGALAAGKAAFSALPAGGKVAAVVAAPVVVGAVASNPKIVNEVAKAPSALANFGSNTANFAANPSIDSAKKIIQQNPIISGALVAGAAVAAGGAVATGVNYLNTQAIKQNTKQIVAGDTSGYVPAGTDPLELAKMLDKLNSTSKEDVKIAEIQAKALAEQNETQIKIAEIQAKALSSQAQPVAAVTPLAATPIKKATVKKKAKKKTTKKKKKVTKKRKVYKRKKKSKRK